MPLDCVLLPLLNQSCFGPIGCTSGKILAGQGKSHKCPTSSSMSEFLCRNSGFGTIGLKADCTLHLTILSNWACAGGSCSWGKGLLWTGDSNEWRRKFMSKWIKHRGSLSQADPSLHLAMKPPDGDPAMNPWAARADFCFLPHPHLNAMNVKLCFRSSNAHTL